MRFNRPLDGPRWEEVMARLGRCGSKQHYHLPHRNANGGIRIPPRQSFLHRTLCKQFMELANENSDCEFSIWPALKYIVVWHVRSTPNAGIRTVNRKATFRELDLSTWLARAEGFRGCCGNVPCVSISPRLTLPEAFRRSSHLYLEEDQGRMNRAVRAFRHPKNAIVMINSQ